MKLISEKQFYKMMEKHNWNEDYYQYLTKKRQQLAEAVIKEQDHYFQMMQYCIERQLFKDASIFSRKYDNIDKRLIKSGF